MPSNRNRNSPSLFVVLFFPLIGWSVMSEARPLILAHRGASGYLPEHTLEAKAFAYALGADYLEQDVVLSRDNKAVVLHDIHLDAVTDVALRFPDRSRPDGRYYAIDFDWKELKSLRVHERTGSDGNPTYPKRFPVESAIFRLHRLQDELQLIAGLNKSTGRTVGICPELKRPAFHTREGKDLAAIALEILNRFGYQDGEDPCLLRSFDSEVLQRLRFEMGCELRLVQLINSSSNLQVDDALFPMSSPHALKKIATYAYGIGPTLELFLSGLDETGRPIKTQLARDARTCNLATFPYTFRDESLPQGMSFEETLQFFCGEIEPTGIMTDFPDRALKIILADRK